MEVRSCDASDSWHNLKPKSRISVCLRTGFEELQTFSCALTPSRWRSPSQVSAQPCAFLGARTRFPLQQLHDPCGADFQLWSFINRKVWRREQDHLHSFFLNLRPLQQQRIFQRCALKCVLLKWAGSPQEFTPATGERAPPRHAEWARQRSVHRSSRKYAGKSRITSLVSS